LPEKYRFLLFEDKREVELVWNGKTSESAILSCLFRSSSRWTSRAQKSREDSGIQSDLFDSSRPSAQGMDEQADLGRTISLILSSLKNGPLREEIEKQGGLKLIYIDPPFECGRGFLDGHRDRRRHLYQEAQSWKKSPTATLGVKVPIHSSP